MKPTDLGPVLSLLEPTALNFPNTPNAAIMTLSSCSRSAPAKRETSSFQYLTHAEKVHFVFPRFDLAVLSSIDEFIEQPGQPLDHTSSMLLNPPWWSALMHLLMAAGKK